MAEAGQEVPKCAYPGCENEARPREAGAAEPGSCGLPDPETGEPHTALTALRRRQVLARQRGGAAGPGDPDPRGSRSGGGASGPRRWPPPSPGRPRPGGMRPRRRRPAQGTPRLSRSVPAPTTMRQPGRPPEDNPNAQRDANALREGERRQASPCEHSFFLSQCAVQQPWQPGNRLLAGLLTHRFTAAYERPQCTPRGHPHRTGQSERLRHYSQSKAHS